MEKSAIKTKINISAVTMRANTEDAIPEEAKECIRFSEPLESRAKTMDRLPKMMGRYMVQRVNVANIPNINAATASAFAGFAGGGGVMDSQLPYDSSL